MNLAELEKQLITIVEDSKISAEEKKVLRGLAVDISADKLRFLRNKAFDFARQEISDSPDNALHTLKWLERLVKAIDLTGDSVVVATSACFSPGIACRNQLLDLLKSAREQVDICVFTISDDRLTQGIISAFKRGVDVRIITDNDKSLDRGSDIYQLIDSGVRLRMDKTAYHMHHKFMLVDSAILVNGSFNWTRSATEKNHENLLVTGDKRLVSQYQRRFDELWQQFA